MTLKFVPRKLITEHEADGWLLVDGYDAPSGWAVLMAKLVWEELDWPEKAMKVAEVA
jgi:hypothetical protein